MHQILTEPWHSCHCNVTHRIRISSQSPLAALNALFPDGIPVSAPYPTLDLRGQECFELANLESLSFAKRVDLMQILFAQTVPDAIGYAYLFYQSVAIPTQWVEEV